MIIVRGKNYFEDNGILNMAKHRHHYPVTSRHFPVIMECQERDENGDLEDEEDRKSWRRRK